MSPGGGELLNASVTTAGIQHFDVGGAIKAIKQTAWFSADLDNLVLMRLERDL